jgi:PKD repeat protein
VDSTTKIVTVYDKPKAGFTAGVACQGAVVALNNNTTYSGAPNKVIYNWNFGDFTPSSSDFNPVKSYGVLGNYTIRLVAKDTVNNCSDTVTKTIEVSEKPLALFAATDGCENSPVNFTNGSIPPVGQTLTYNWAFGDGGTATATNATHAYSKNGKYGVTLTATTNKGCSDVKGDSVTIAVAPKATFTVDSINCYTLKFTPGTAGLGGYEWDFGDGTKFPTGSGSVTNIYQSSGIHKVKLTVTSNVGGCKGDTTIDVRTWCNVGIDEVFASKFNLSVYPNPFEQSANISYNLNSSEDVTVTVYDLIGRNVAQVKHVNQSAGNHTVKL